MASSDKHRGLLLARLSAAQPADEAAGCQWLPIHPYLHYMAPSLPTHQFPIQSCTGRRWCLRMYQAQRGLFQLCPHFRWDINIHPRNALLQLCRLAHPRTRSQSHCSGTGAPVAPHPVSGYRVTRVGRKRAANEQRRSLLPSRSHRSPTKQSGGRAETAGTPRQAARRVWRARPLFLPISIRLQAQRTMIREHHLARMPVWAGVSPLQYWQFTPLWHFRGTRTV